MEKIASDSPLSDAQTATLVRIVGLMIPASEAHGVPGADDEVILADIVATARQHADVVIAGLDDVDERARSAHETAFAEIDADAAMAIVDEVQQSAPHFMRVIVSMTVQCYYRDPRVMESLGMEARAPFPQGFEVAQGDWSLLEPVRERGPVWRDAG